jgi:hypothetical protein
MNNETRIVEVKRWIDPAPILPGWIPWWVNINLNRVPVKIITYKKVPDDH